MDNEDIYGLNCNVYEYPVLKDAHTGLPIYLGDTIKMKEDLYCEKFFKKNVFFLHKVGIDSYANQQHMGQTSYFPIVTGLKVILKNYEKIYIFYPKYPTEGRCSFIHCRGLIIEKKKRDLKDSVSFY